MSFYTIFLVLIIVYYHRIAEICFSYHIISYTLYIPLHILFILFYVYACKYHRSGYERELYVHESTIRVLYLYVPEGTISVRDSDLYLYVPEGTITVRDSDLCMIQTGPL